MVSRYLEKKCQNRNTHFGFKNWVKPKNVRWASYKINYILPWEYFQGELLHYTSLYSLLKIDGKRSVYFTPTRGELQKLNNQKHEYDQ